MAQGKLRYGAQTRETCAMARGKLRYGAETRETCAVARGRLRYGAASIVKFWSFAKILILNNLRDLNW